MKMPEIELSGITFESRELIGRWKDFFEANPFGDYYRLSTINPLVLQTARWAVLRKEAPDLLPFPVDTGTAIFSQLGDHSDINPESIFRKFHSQLIKHSASWKPLSGLRVLDLGCGTGYRAEILSNLGAAYTGVDRREEFIQFAKERFKHPNARFDRVNLDTFQGRSGRFRIPETDLALSVMVLEHLSKPEILLEHLRRIASTRPLALLLVTENPSYYRSSLSETPVWVRPAKITRVPIVCLRGLEVNINPREPHDISILLRDAGFTVLEDGYSYLPGKWPNFVRAHYECKNRGDVNWGLAPFRSIVAQPLPISSSTGTVSFATLVEHSALKELDRRPHQALLGEIKRTGRFVALPAGRILLTRRDLGGCLYFVIKGSLASIINPKFLSPSMIVSGSLRRIMA